MRLKAGAAKVGGRTLPKRKGWVGGRTRFGTRTTGSTWANEANPVNATTEEFFESTGQTDNRAHHTHETAQRSEALGPLTRYPLLA